MPVVLLLTTITMLVLRAGASRIFFDVVGSFQATRLIGDAQAKITVLQGLVLDGLSGITEGVGIISEQMDALVNSTVPLAQELGYARIEFEKFLQEGENVAELTAQIEDLGTKYGFTADQALAAGAKMAQLSSVVGGGAAIPAATEIGVAFGMVGGMETEEAMKRLIALQQQTTFMYGGLTQAQFRTLSAQKQVNLMRQESISLLNQLNTVENRSSATMAQVTMVMNQFASSAKLAGDSVSYMAAMSATLIEAGEEQGKAGRALKMMYARLGADTGNNSEILRKYGIETKNANGQLRSMHDILRDISAIYPRLANNHRLEIAQAIAGNDHYVRAIKLMEGYNRTVELNGMAIAELDTAQDELNKRFEDNAFLLTQAESRLADAKAAVGDLFTPAVIRATNAQAALNEALAGMAADSPALAGLLDVMFSMQQMGKVYAPIVETNLNMMSLTVSLQTQLQIQRAIGGQALVNASAYGKQGEMVRANLMSLTNTAHQQNRQALIAASLLNMDKQKAQLQQRVLGLTMGETTNNLADLNVQKKNLMMRVQELQTKQNEMNTLKVMNKTEHDRMMAEKRRIDFKASDLQQEKNKLQVISMQTAYENARGKTGRLANVEAQRLMSYKKGHYIHAKAQKKMEQSELEIKKKQAEIENKLLVLNSQRAAIGLPITKMQQQELKDKQKQLQLTNQQIAEEGERAIFSLMNAQAIGGETKAAQILRNAHIELINVTKMKSSSEVQSTKIMKQAEIAARELALAYGLDEAALRRLIPQMTIFTQALDRVEEQSKLTVNAGMAMQMGLMKTTGLIGGASMALSFFTDNEKAARASMFLMQLSMIPMTVQMVVATKASFGLMAGIEGVDKSAKKATISMKALAAGAAAFAKATVVLALIGAAVYYLLPDVKDEADELAASLETVSATAIYTGDAYRQMANDLATTSLEGIGQLTLDKEQEIERIKNEMVNITEPALLRIKKDQLQIAKDELATLEQIQAVRQAESLLGDPKEAENVYNMIKDAYALEPDEQTKFDIAKGLALNPLETFGAGVAYTISGDKSHLLKHSYAQEQMAANKAFEDALAAIPEEYRGAIKDAALYAEDFPDFLDILERDFKEFGGADLFNNFTDTIQEDFIGPIEAAKEAAFEFANAREEMFFGMAKGNITSDMVKQVVNKGVETLINTTEVIMTNNFTGMTTTQAANEITKQVVAQLNGLGMNIQQT